MKKFIVCLIVVCCLIFAFGCKKSKGNNASSSQLNSSSFQSSFSSDFDLTNSASSAMQQNSSDSKSVGSSLISSSSIENSSNNESISSKASSSFSQSLNSNINNNSSQINSSSSEPLYSYTLTLDPESESQYITVKMYLGDKEVTQAQAGEKVTIVITSSDGVRRAIGVVAINGITVFSSTLYEQEVSGTVTMVEGGLQIYVKLILQNDYD
ncbi:MAG: hypothetical protein J6C97_02030 [Clostridia bacterium]|nr:hypothetical protein [Clostridia bacterium]